MAFDPENHNYFDTDQHSHGFEAGEVACTFKFGIKSYAKKGEQPTNDNTYVVLEMTLHRDGADPWPTKDIEIGKIDQYQPSDDGEYLKAKRKVWDASVFSKLMRHLTTPVDEPGPFVDGDEPINGAGMDKAFFVTKDGKVQPVSVLNGTYEVRSVPKINAKTGKQVTGQDGRKKTLIIPVRRVSGDDAAASVEIPSELIEFVKGEIKAPTPMKTVRAKLLSKKLTKLLAKLPALLEEGTAQGLWVFDGDTLSPAE